MKFISKLIPVLQYINLACLLALVASLPFAYEYRKLWGILFLVTFPLKYAVSQRWRNFKMTKARWYFVAMVAFFCLMFVYYPFETDKRLWHRLLDYRLSLAGFGLVGFLGLSPKVKLPYVLNTFIISAIGVTCYLIFYRIGWIAFWNDPNRIAVLQDVSIRFVNPHPIFNFCFNLALTSVWYMLYAYWQRIPNIIKPLYFIAAAVIYYVLLTSVGRTGVFTAIVITMLFVILTLWRYRKWLGIAAMVIAPFVIHTGISLHKRISTAPDDPRFFLWKMSWTLIKEKPLLGYGAANAQTALDTMRKNHPDMQVVWWWVWQPHDFVDAHSQYVITALEYGLLGMLFLWFLYLAPFFWTARRLRPLLIVILTMIIIESTTDSVLHRQDMCGIFCILMIIVFAQQSKKESA